jgi:hypothetical protein
MNNLKFKNLMSVQDLNMIKGGSDDRVDPVKNLVDPVKNVVDPVKCGCDVVDPVKNVAR